MTSNTSAATVNDANFTRHANQETTPNIPTEWHHNATFHSDINHQETASDNIAASGSLLGRNLGYNTKSRITRTKPRTKTTTRKNITHILHKLTSTPILLLPNVTSLYQPIWDCCFCSCCRRRSNQAMKTTTTTVYAASGISGKGEDFGILSTGRREDSNCDSARQKHHGGIQYHERDLMEESFSLEQNHALQDSSSSPSHASDSKPTFKLFRSFSLPSVSIIHFFLCLFAFFYFLRPSEPFLVEYLVRANPWDRQIASPTHSHHHLTVQQLLTEVFPLWTYSYPVFQLLVGLLSDTVIPLKCLIIVGLVAAQIAAILIIFPAASIQTLLSMSMPSLLLRAQISEFFIALSLSCHQAYFAMLYHVTSRSHYQRITSWTRFFYLTGHTTGALLGQLWWIFACQSGVLSREGKHGFFNLPTSESTAHRLEVLFFITIAASAISTGIAYVVFPSGRDEYLVERVKGEAFNLDSDDHPLSAGKVHHVEHHDHITDGHNEDSQGFDSTDVMRDGSKRPYLSVCTKKAKHSESPTELDSLLMDNASSGSTNSASTRSIAKNRMLLTRKSPSPLLVSPSEPIVNTPTSVLLSTPPGTPSKDQDLLLPPSPSLIRQFLTPISLFFKQIFHAYTIFDVLFWSLFNIVTVAVHQLAITYYQTLFKRINPHVSYNGFVIALAYILAAFTTLIPSKFSGETWKRHQWSTRILCIITVLCMCLLLMSLSQLSSDGIFMLLLPGEFLSSPLTRLLLAYSGFILYHCMFELLYVIATAQIASSMKCSRFAAIFSLNSLCQNLCQAVFQFAMGSVGWHLNSFQQYFFFGALLFGLAVGLYMLAGLHSVYSTLKSSFISLLNRQRSRKAFSGMIQ